MISIIKLQKQNAETFIGPSWGANSRRSSGHHLDTAQDPGSEPYLNGKSGLNK